MKFFNKRDDKDEVKPDSVEETVVEPKTLAPRATSSIPTGLPKGMTVSSSNPFSALSADEPTLSESNSDDGRVSENNVSKNTASEKIEDSVFETDNDNDLELSDYTDDDFLPREGSSTGFDNSISSPETIAQRSEETEPFDNDSPTVDEQEVLEKVETSALKEEKEPVLEIITPTYSEVPLTRRERRLAEENKSKSVVSDDEEADKKKSDKSPKKSRSWLKKKKDEETEDKDPLKVSFNESPEDDGEEEEEPKKKRSLSEMTLKDLLPKKKKDSTELSIPLGENILIDLMPQSHKDIVATREAKRKWTGIFAAVVVGCVVASGAAFGYNLQTQSSVAKELAKQEEIDLQIARHADVNQALQSEESARGLLETAAGNEIDWNKLISTIEGNLPAGTNISSLTVVNGGTVNDEISSAVTMNLTSDTTLGYSDALNAVEGINGVQQVEIGGLTTGGENAYVYTMSFTFDTSILTERFAAEVEPEPVETDSTDPSLTDPTLNEPGLEDPSLTDPNLTTETDGE